jgi:regulator of protease activity HflC (stomatin/prohibitin superfamily)
MTIYATHAITIGIVAGEAFDGAGFLQDMNLDRQGEFLTGDKNVLNAQVNVQYAITDPHRYFFDCRSPETGLRLLAESLVAEKIAQSSVDYVYPLGLSELRVVLTQSVRRAVENQPWGIAVDNVTITSLPPVEVKAAFLDVSNARAEKDRVGEHLAIDGHRDGAAQLVAQQRAGARVAGQRQVALLVRGAYHTGTRRQLFSERSDVPLRVVYLYTGPHQQIELHLDVDREMVLRAAECISEAVEVGFVGTAGGEFGPYARG